MIERMCKFCRFFEAEDDYCKELKTFKKPEDICVFFIKTRFPEFR